jgi:pilus assembly protein CpaE
MLRSLVISPDQELAQAASRVLQEIGTINIVRYLEQYTAADEMGRVVRATAPQVAFISCESMDLVVEEIRILESLAPGIQFIGMARDCDPQLLLDAMRVGMREFITMPFNPQQVYEAVSRVQELLEKRPATVETTNDIYCFLPAKAGVGASTLALNVSVAMSKIAGQNVILSDFDLNSGMMRFMLKLTNEFSVADACEHAMNMDESLWPQLVTKMGSLDVLHAGKLNPNLRVEGTQIRHLIDFLRRNYRGMVFDLSGNLERYSFEIMHECKKIFLVCTPEIPSLHLAREKFVFLRGLDLQDKVSVLVNRCQKRQVITNEQIEQILGLPVHQVFPNDYNTVHKALTVGKWVDFNSDLGKSINSFAKTLVDVRGPATAQHETPAKRKFLDFFSGSNFGAKAS